MKLPPFNELAQPKMNRKAKRVMRKALNESCKEQAKFMNKGCGNIIKRLSKLK